VQPANSVTVVVCSASSVVPARRVNVTLTGSPEGYPLGNSTSTPPELSLPALNVTTPCDVVPPVTVTSTSIVSAWV
jgi:hypothetical protein